MNNQTQPPVDVNALMAEIRKNIKSAEPSEAPVSDDPSLYEDLKMAANTFSGGHWPSGGYIALFRKAVYRLLGLKDFNGRIISMLTRIISLIDGTDVTEKGMILNNQRRTMVMLSQMVKRLDGYDNEKLGERLSVLEKEIKNRQVSENR